MVYFIYSYITFDFSISFLMFTSSIHATIFNHTFQKNKQPTKLTNKQTKTMEFILWLLPSRTLLHELFIRKNCCMNFRANELQSGGLLFNAFHIHICSNETDWYDCRMAGRADSADFFFNHSAFIC